MRANRTDAAIPFSYIRLDKYLDKAQVHAVRNLYALFHWPWHPPDALLWSFGQVCELYFRAQRHADIFGNDPAQAAALGSIEKAIADYLEDEFS